MFFYIKNSLKFLPKSPINNKPAPGQIMGWSWTGNKPLSEPKLYPFIYASLSLDELTVDESIVPTLRHPSKKHSALATTLFGKLGRHLYGMIFDLTMNCQTVAFFKLQYFFNEIHSVHIFFTFCRMYTFYTYWLYMSWFWKCSAIVYIIYASQGPRYQCYVCQWCNGPYCHPTHSYYDGLLLSNVPKCWSTL